MLGWDLRTQLKTNKFSLVNELPGSFKNSTTDTSRSTNLISGDTADEQSDPETCLWFFFFAVAKEAKDARSPFLEKLPDRPDQTYLLFTLFLFFYKKVLCIEKYTRFKKCT